MIELKNKIAIVTGGASGIGASSVECLIAEDVKHITIFDIAEEMGLALQNRLNQKYKSEKVKFTKCDVTNKAQLADAIRKVKEEHGTIDVIINSAGILDEDLNTFDKAIDVNFTGLVTCSLHAWHIMNKEKGGNGGTIINIGSVTAFSNTTTIPVYSSIKSAVIKFGTSLGAPLHFSRSEVRVVTVCMGATNTPLVQNLNHRLFTENIQEEFSKQINKFNFQSSEEAASGIINILKTAISGSVWIVSSGREIDVTKMYNKGNEMFDEYIYNYSKEEKCISR